MNTNFLTLIARLYKLLKDPLVAKISIIFVGISSTIWFLVRVIPKPSRATYPCMRAAAPLMSGFIIWMMALLGSSLAFTKAREFWKKSKYATAILFLLVSIGAAMVMTSRSDSKASTASEPLKIWYKPNEPMGVARGIFPGRVYWAHNPNIASWDGKTGFWWEDQYNNQKEVDKLLSQTLTGLTDTKNETKAWDALFKHFNKVKHSNSKGYSAGEKVAIKINNNNTYAHKSNNEINANPQLILSLLKSLVNEAKIAQENITVAEPSRFITDNIYEKCHALFPNVHYVDHDGMDGREKAEFVANAIPYSADNGKVDKGLAKCIVDADYVISMALFKGHVSQGVTLSAKNYYGCTSIQTDWRKNAHSSGFSQNRDGSFKYLIFTDFLGHKDLGEKTMLFLIDGIYGNKFVDQVPAYKWKLAPFNGQWPNSLFASQDGVAVDAVALDFIITEWPDAPDMMYSDYYLMESAMANNPPSKTKYDPEQDGTGLPSLGVFEHWNNAQDKKYTRNLKTGSGIELIYKKVN
jgi:uncharacterized protein (DUF362 family)